MSSTFIRRTALFICSFFALAQAACSHVVTIDSEPPGATIYVEGEKLGTAPVLYTEKTGWEKSYLFEAKKTGYAKTRREVTQSGWNTNLLLVSCGLACLPFGWIGSVYGLLNSRQLPDDILIKLDRKGGGRSSRSEDTLNEDFNTRTDDEPVPDSDDDSDEDYGY